MSFSHQEVFWLEHVRRLDCGNGALENQDFSFCRLDEDLIGIVAFHGAGDRLASRYEEDNDLLAFELGDELRAGLPGCLLFCHSITSRTVTIPFS